MKKRPLFRQSFLVLMLMMLIAIVPIAVFNTYNFKTFYYSETEEYLKESCILLKNVFPQSLASTDIAGIEKFAYTASSETDMRVTIINENGLVLADSQNDPDSMNNHADRPEVSAALSGNYGSSTRNSATMSFEMMYSAVPVSFSDSTNGAIRLARSLEDIDSRLSLINRSVVILSIILFIAVGVLSYILAGWVSRIINELKQTAAMYAAGDFSKKLFIERPQEISELSDDINSMGMQLQDRINKVETQKNELQLILNNMTEPVLFTDRRLHILRINSAAETLFHFNEENDRGRSILELFRNSDLNNFAQSMVETGTSKTEIITLDLPRPAHLEIHGTVVKDAEGEVSALLLVMHDITRMKQLEQMRKDFVANVSHELKTPVTMIKGYIETLLDSMSPEEGENNTIKFLGIMEKHSSRIEAIIDDLLLLSGIEKNDGNAPLFEEIPAIDLLTSAVTSCEPRAEDKNIKLKMNCPENIILRVHPLLAEQAVINLIDNGIKYSGTNTEIKVSVKQNDEGKTCISVKDQGCGISQEDQERIFERFYRVDKARSRESGGTGLGLSIVKHIALSHNGSISVESTPGKGSTFTICL